LGKTVQELLSGIPGPLMALEETYWISYHKSSPFGDDRADLRSAQIAQILWNSNVKKGDARPVTDFLPFHHKPARQGDSNKTLRSNFDQLIARQKR
jgi:hypothetical protein